MLAEKGELPNRLVDIAHNIRQLRNIGVHEPYEGLSQKELPILDNLIKAVLEYLYVAPNLIRQAEVCLEDLKQKQSSV